MPATYSLLTIEQLVALFADDVPDTATIPCGLDDQSLNLTETSKEVLNPDPNEASELTTPRTTPNVPHDAFNGMITISTKPPIRAHLQKVVSSNVPASAVQAIPEKFSTESIPDFESRKRLFHAGLGDHVTKYVKTELNEALTRETKTREALVKTQALLMGKRKARRRHISNARELEEKVKLMKGQIAILYTQGKNLERELHDLGAKEKNLEIGLENIGKEIVMLKDTMKEYSPSDEMGT